MWWKVGINKINNIAKDGWQVKRWLVSGKERGRQGKLWGVARRWERANSRGIGIEGENEGVPHHETVATRHLVPHNWVIVFLGRRCQGEGRTGNRRLRGADKGVLAGVWEGEKGTGKDKRLW